jgi:hypothetical protein
MSRNKALFVVATTLALGILGVASAVASDRTDRGVPRGYVLPCSLVGVNPIYHPEVFGNPVWAREYGFVQGPDRVSRVVSGCHRY